MADGFFRSKNGFTVVQNAITRDRNISLKAKGLYLVIQSYITMPNAKWKKDDFLAMSLEGEKAFDSAWTELKEAGYLHVHFFPDGKRFYTEYELLDEAVAGPHTFYYNSAGELTRTNIDRAVTRKEKAEALASEVAKEAEKSASESENQRTPQNGGNAKSGQNQRTPHYGSNADGSNAEGSNAFGGNKENIIPSVQEHNEKPTNSPLEQTDQASGCVRKDSNTAVILDPSKKILAGDVFDIRETVKESGLPYEIAYDVEIATKYLMVLTDMDFLLSDCREDTMRYDATLLAIKSLIEMITAKDVRTYYGAKVTSSNVIDQLNIILKINEYSLSLFISFCADKFVENITQKQINNHSGYMKSILWGNISSFALDWNAFVHRSQMNLLNR